MEESRNRQGKTSGTRNNPILVPEGFSVRHAGESYIARVTFDELMSRGVYLFYRQHEHDAVECLRLALTQQPTDLRARYLISLAAQLHSDEETIEQMAQSAREIDPRMPMPWPARASGSWTTPTSRGPTSISSMPC